VPVFDANVLGAMFGSETTVIASVLQTFMGSAHSHLDEVALAVAAHDMTTVASLAHKITGACRMSGALALGEAARALEQAAKQGDDSAAQHKLVELNTQWVLLQQAIGAQPAG
jgi:HPt (histidine-containing phosphotransfer) domain-containing protein